MFRGEPIALWTLLFGFISFIFVQLFGLIVTNTIDSEAILPLQAHFYLAYFGWIGLTILGAQLQFFKAITGLRRYTPYYLRYLYHAFLLSGLFLLVYGSYYRENEYVTIGFVFYLVGVFIHTFWIVKQSGSKYFKFPLDYMFVSNLYLIAALIILFLSNSSKDYYIVSLSVVRHILSIGWISLTLKVR